MVPITDLKGYIEKARFLQNVAYLVCPAKIKTLYYIYKLNVNNSSHL